MSDPLDQKAGPEKAKPTDAGLELDEVDPENIDERLQEIEKRITKIEKESRVGVDDQYRVTRCLLCVFRICGFLMQTKVYLFWQL